MNMRTHFFLIISLSTICYGINTEEIFLQANKAYYNQEYQRALDLYTLIDNKASTVWYDMGNAAYKLEHFVEAMFFWKRAQRNADPTLMNYINHNLELVKKKFNHDHDDYPTRITNVVLYYSSWLSLLWWQFLFLMLWFIVVFKGYDLYKSRKYWILWCALVVLSILGLMMCTKYRFNNRTFGIVKNPDVPVYVGADEKLSVRTMLHTGDELHIIEKQDDWLKIKIHDVVGWVHATMIEHRE